MPDKQEILRLNEKQREFYNYNKKNFATHLWGSVRSKTLRSVRVSLGVEQQVYAVHKEWLGDLSTKKVLDLGCLSGNVLSIYMAKHAKSYVGIDLSDVAIAKLADKIEPYSNARAIAVDFLSDEFKEADFDIIYAYGVLHHFENIEVLISRLKEKLLPGGKIITYDPLATSWLSRLLRTLYRPFQTDAAWEWPFTMHTVKQFSGEFTVLERHGILGKSKWFFLINLLPIHTEKKRRIGEKWKDSDFINSMTNDDALYNCLHLTMHLQFKPTKE